MNQSLMAAAETTLPPYLTTTTWPPDYSDDGSGEREESSGSGDYQFTGDTGTGGTGDQDFGNIFCQTQWKIF
jgi:hypothetical protein